MRKIINMGSKKLIIILLVATLCFSGNMLFILNSDSVCTAQYDIWNGNAAEAFAGGDGTEDDPYQISTGAHLRLLAEAIYEGNSEYNGEDIYFVLLNDIYLNDTNDWENWGIEAPENHWMPIGAEARKFLANFNGQGYVVRGAYIDVSDNYQGLFGWVDGGSIINLGIEESYIRGDRFVGSVAGFLNRGQIINCHNKSLVSGSEFVGGITGSSFSDNTIIRCYNTGIITGIVNVGGIVGYSNNDSIITHCYNAGSVFGDYSVGGLAGGMQYSAIENCFNMGTVTGEEEVGGLAGVLYSSAVINSYNTADVTGKNYVGGIAGININNIGDILNCYNTGEINGLSFIGGILGYVDFDTDTLIFSGGIFYCYAYETISINVGLPIIGNVDNPDSIPWIVVRKFGSDGVLSNQVEIEHAIEDVGKERIYTLQSLLGALNSWVHVANASANNDSFLSFKNVGSSLEGIKYEFTQSTGLILYTIYYNNMIGIVNNNPKEFSIESPIAALSLIAPYKNGYVFEGWYDNADFTGAQVTQIAAGSDIIASGKTELILYAKWAVMVCVVTFDTNGGSVAPSAQSVNFGGYVSSVPEPSKRGYTFLGWFANDTEIPWNFDTMTVRDNVTLTARWEKNPSNVFSWIVVGVFIALIAGGVGFVVWRGKSKSPKADM